MDNLKAKQMFYKYAARECLAIEAMKDAKRAEAFLLAAGATKSIAYLRRAMKSIDGAIRSASLKASRYRREAGV